jgi:inorganic pyrophosphatase
MASKKKKRWKRALGNPAVLAPFDANKSDLRVIIETPKGSRNKYAFDEKEKVFCLKKVLPAGMAFPYDFGFVPSTLAEDGDPVDVLVLMDEPAFPGCVLDCRAIGVIQGEEGKKKNWKRNDRIVAIEKDNHSFADIRVLSDLGKEFLAELEEFFVNYRRLSDKEYRIIAAKGPEQALRLAEKGIRAFKKES